ncbi:MAG TPA: Hint domain-containing protein [Beijerinckiaceae bacterium]|jgi:hypothetical protein
MAQFQTLTFSYVRTIGPHANDVAQRLGISSNAVLGSVANEFDARLTASLNPLDPTFKLGAVPQMAADLVALRASDAFLRQNLLETQNISEAQAGSAGMAFKLNNPVLIDVGPGNISIRTAIRLLDHYAVENPGDPLGVLHYRSDYSRLVSDLIDWGQDTTVKFAGLMIKEAQTFFETNAANWNSLSHDERDALMVTYYKLGRERFEQDAAASNNVGQPYNPSIGDIGRLHLDNAGELDVARTQGAATGPFFTPPECFLAGTPILMADGTEKPIEEVRAGDRVMSFDAKKDKGRGGLVPGEVVRTFQNVTKTIIDLHGLKVTPGHRFLTGEGTFETIAEILRRDGTIVTVDRGEVRARTNAKAGSPEDRPVQIVYRDPAGGGLRRVVARAGIPALFRADAPDRPLSTARFLQEAGMELLDDGMIREPGGRIVFCDWPEGATPLDLPLQRNHVISIDGRPYVPEWIAGLSEDEDGLLEAVGDFGPRPSAGAPAGFRPTLAAANPRPLNRRERRKAAALERVK